MLVTKIELLVIPNSLKDINMGFCILAASLCLLIFGNLVESAPVCNACDAESERIVKEIIFLLTCPRDCADISKHGRKHSGVYVIATADRKPWRVYCDLRHPGGGWLVFQRRMNGRENFYRDWLDYQIGFGNIEDEFWFGNELLHKLTTAKKYKLRIDMMDFAGATRYAEYSTFSVGSSASGYKLTVGGYSGDAGDSLSQHSGMMFSTKNDDRDTHATVSCAQLFKGGWWYAACHASNLNGLYLHGKHASYADGVEWFTWLGHYYSLKFTEMKIAPA